MLAENLLEISAHKYGNYHKYYTFHPATSRTSLINKENVYHKVWCDCGRPLKFFILDIGCNEGDLSKELFLQARKELPDSVECHLLGIDIDSSLIELAKNKYKVNEDKDFIDFHTVDIMDTNTSKLFFSNYLNNYSVSGFSFISLFSITMWIHLNHGNEGLKSFINSSVDLLETKGSLLIEPQPWKCYKNAEKRCRKLGLEKPKYYDEINRCDIDELIRNILKNDFHMTSCWEIGKEDWGRSIMIFSEKRSMKKAKLSDV